ncbi:hypothetical protein SOVF_077910, partial [Spinacia oleracea]
MFKNPVEKYVDTLNDLVNVVDTMLEVNVGGYVSGTMSIWPTEIIEIVGTTDHRSCGVMILGCMKACAPRFVSQFAVVDLVKARTTLILEDVLSEYNDISYAMLDAMLPQ